MRSVLAAITVAVTVFSATVSAEDAAWVLVYSQRSTPARKWMPVSLDGEVIAEVKQGYYFAVHVGDGDHSLALRGGVPVAVQVASGGEVYVRVGWHHEVGRQPIPVLTRVDEKQARIEMRLLSYVEAKRVHSETVPSADPRPVVVPRLIIRGPQ